MRRLSLILIPLIAASFFAASLGTPAQAAKTKSTFLAEVWADNWFALYVNGKKVGQDSVPITTERSFNAERITFTATYPLTIAIMGKDFKENDSGLEYIGTDRQQMGDGGLIAQITDTKTKKVVAATGSSWKALVIHEAPLNPSCVNSRNPQTDCKSLITPTPKSWTKAKFSAKSWPKASTYTPQQVGVKEGYNEIRWSPNAKLIWGPNLETDNTVLFRTYVKR